MKYEDREYKVGDHVEIINYGSIIYSKSNLLFKSIGVCGSLQIYDMSPELIGKQGIIDGSSTVQGRTTYSISGINKHAWYDKQQLKLIDV